MPRPFWVTSSDAVGQAAGRLSGGEGLFPLVPVVFACGIAGWFALPQDPPAVVGPVVAGFALACLGLARRAGEAGRLLALAAALAAAGFVAADLRAGRVAAPVLDGRSYGPVEGRVVAIDRSVSDAVRITLDRVTLPDRDPAGVPRRVRVALHGAAADRVPAPGDIVILTGHLAPPEGPVAPGGFDFARLAWFDGLGAVGYTRTPVLRLDRDDGGARLARIRTDLSRAVQAAVPGSADALAAALATGDRSGLPRADVEAMRAANLSHLLAISGLHLGLLAGVVFSAVRIGFALLPWLGLRLPGKKIAAVAAIAAAAVYLALSGGNVATQRAFVMVACLFGAVLADRRGLSLRGLALAALLILSVAPESLREVGFQMSFAATTALVAVFGGVAGRWQGRLPVALAWLAALVLSSAVAGAATAPIAAAQFNRFAEYGLLANLLAVPVMGTLVIPGAVLAAVLAPLGLAAPGLWMMEIGCRWVLMVAHAVSGLDGAVLGVPSPPDPVLPLLAAAGLWAVLVPGRWRAMALLPAALAALLWSQSDRPVLLISADGGLVGVLGPDGRSLSKPRGAGFVAANWLEDDGDLVPQEMAATRPGFTGPPGDRRALVAGQVLWHVTGKAAQDRAVAACRDGAIVVANVPMPGPVPGDCLLFDQTRLAETGALALFPGRAGHPLWRPARDPRGDRRWTPWARGQ